MENEVWKDVIGYEGMYQVSNIGRVKSLPRKVQVGKQLNQIKGGIRKLTTDKDGYKIVGFNTEGKCKLFKVHRLVAIAFIPNPDCLPIVNHIYGIKDDNNAKNLEWATNAENTQHAYATGLIQINRGSECAAAKHTESDIQRMRKMAASGVMHKDIASEYNISAKSIHNIISRKSWQHI